MPKTPGAFLVHSWCTPGALLVHSWCTPGALLVHSWCTPGALLVHSWCTLGALQRFPEKGIASLPKGSLDPPFRNVWIAFSLTYKPERELHRFRKEASILRTETFWIAFSPICKPERELHRFRKEVSILRKKRLDRLLANLQTRKGIAPLPKGSDSPHRNIWIAFSPTCKPEREIAPLPTRSLDPPYRNVWIAQDITNSSPKEA